MPLPGSLWLPKRWLQPSPDRPPRLAVLSALQDTFFAKLQGSRSVCELPSLRLKPKAVLESYVSVGGLRVTWPGAGGLCALLCLHCALSAGWPVPGGELVPHAAWPEAIGLMIPTLCCGFSSLPQRYPW